MPHDPQSEAARVRAEAEKIKRAAMASGVPQLISDLYHDNITHFPSWINLSPRDYVPAIVTRAEKKQPSDKETKEELNIDVNGHSYTFRYKEHSSFMSDSDDMFGDLQLCMGDTKVLGLNESVSYGQWNTTYRVFGVDAFIQGPWIEDFKQLKAAISEAKKNREKAQFENQEEIDKLKRNFGID